MRIGQKNGATRLWARQGTRPRQPADQRYANAYIFGAICPERGVGAALVRPYCDTTAMQAHLDEISVNVAKQSHAVVLMDRAGWHTTGKLKSPENVSIICLPPKSPELNPPLAHVNMRCRAVHGKHLAIHAPKLALQSRIR
jgi:putative transposase